MLKRGNYNYKNNEGKYTYIYICVNIVMVKKNDMSGNLAFLR